MRAMAMISRRNLLLLITISMAKTLVRTMRKLEQIIKQFTYVYDSKDDKSGSCKDKNKCTFKYMNLNMGTKS